MARCPDGHVTREGRPFCPECGKAVEQLCPNGHAVRAGKRYCAKCGAVVAPAEEKAAQAGTGRGPAQPDNAGSAADLPTVQGPRTQDPAPPDRPPQKAGLKAPAPVASTEPRRNRPASSAVLVGGVAGLIVLVAAGLGAGGYLLFNGGSQQRVSAVRPAPTQLPAPTTAATQAPVTAVTPTTSAGPYCPPLQKAVDGSDGPLFCSDGSPSPAAVSYYQSLAPSTFALRSSATSSTINSAICSDLPRSSIPIEGQALTLAGRKYGFAIPGDAPTLVSQVSGSCSGSGGANGGNNSGTGPTYAITHDVTIRTGPTTGSQALGTIPAGTNVAVSCVAKGDTINDIYGPDSSWDRVTYSGATGYVTDEWVDTKGAVRDPTVIPPC